MSDIIVTVGEEGTPPVVIITPGETVLPTASVQVQTQEETPVVHIHIDENSAQSAADSAAAAQAALDALSGISITGCIEKAEFAEATMTGDSYLQFSIPQFSSIRFIGDSTIFRGVYLFPGYKAYSGKKLTLKNFQTTDIILTHLDSDVLINTPLYFSSETDYILKPGKIIEFSLSMITNRFEVIASESNQSDDYSKVVYFNAVTPVAATIFDLNNPPVTNDNTLKEDDANLYIGTDTSTWVYKTSITSYQTKAISAISSNFHLAGTTTDAGNNKTAAIERTGPVGVGTAIASNHAVTKAQHDTKGDMTTNTNQTVSGVKTFLAGKFGLRNTANTFTSFFANAVTAARTWTFPDKNGTVAMTSDIPGVPIGGTTNKLIKFTGPANGGNSRVIDTGTYLGIDVVNSPVKDIALRYTNNRSIGIELSDSATKGADLSISAGSTVNYVLNGNFVPLGQNIGNNTFAITGAPNGDMYASRYGGDIYKQTNSAGLFNPIGQGGNRQRYQNIIASYNGDVYDIAYNTNVVYLQTSGSSSFSATAITGAYGVFASGSLPNGDVYISGDGDAYVRSGGVGNFIPAGVINRTWKGFAGSPSGHMYAILPGSNTVFKRTAGVGDFISLGFTAMTYTAITVDINNNVYVATSNGDIYVQVNGSGALLPLGQTSRDWTALGSSIHGFVYAATRNGDIYVLNTNSLGVANLDGGTLKNEAGTGKGTGKSRHQIWTGQKTVSGRDMQVLTLRSEIDENGVLKRIGTPVYADNAAALSGGLTAGMEYRTATGIKMEVY